MSFTPFDYEADEARSAWAAAGYPGPDLPDPREYMPDPEPDDDLGYDRSDALGVPGDPVVNRIVAARYAPDDDYDTPAIVDRPPVDAAPLPPPDFDPADYEYSDWEYDPVVLRAEARRLLTIANRMDGGSSIVYDV